MTDGTLDEVSPTDGALRSEARLLAESVGGEVVQHALALLEAKDGVLPLLAVELLVEIPGWDEVMMAAVGEHADWAVALYAVQALRDQGRETEAAALLERFLARTPDRAALVADTAARALPGTVLRGLLGLLASEGHDELRQALATQVAANVDSDYSARMRALLDQREWLSLDAFRARVRDAAAAAEEGSVWQAGVRRLDERLQGPVQIIGGPQFLTVADVETMVSREYPAMFEDLALRIEMLLRTPDGRVGKGVVTQLRALSDNARKYPLSTEEGAALGRIDAFAALLREEDLSRLSPMPPMD